MFKTTISPTFTPIRRTFATMKDGEIGRIVSGSVLDFYQGDTVLRTFEAVASLTTPGRWWSGIQRNNTEVELLPPGTKILIEVTE